MFYLGYYIRLVVTKMFCLGYYIFTYKVHEALLVTTAAVWSTNFTLFFSRLNSYSITTSDKEKSPSAKVTLS